jgi:DNA modification methylase
MQIKNELSLGKYFTFDPSKDKHIYNWFYYKEAFSPEVVEYMAQNHAPDAETVFDPFCGAGTTMLYAKQHGMKGFSVDASPLAVFVARTKCDDYSPDDLVAAEGFLSTFGERVRKGEAPKLDWQFELFSPSKAFMPANLNSLLAIRGLLEELENQKASNLLMLALLSVMPQCSLIVKDGGVLKVDKKKSAMPVKEAFRRKAKEMIEQAKAAPRGPLPDIQLGDARQTDFGEASADLIVTSPPYLNNIDYSKVYGLELSLLGLDKRITLETRNRSMRSFITSTAVDKTELAPEVAEFADKIPIVGSYFADTQMILREMHRVLRPEGVAGYVVGNAVIHETHILVDEIIGEMAEKLGFEVEIVVGLERLADVRPAKVKTRESMIVLRKP